MYAEQPKLRDRTALEAVVRDPLRSLDSIETHIAPEVVITARTEAEAVIRDRQAQEALDALALPDGCLVGDLLKACKKHFIETGEWLDPNFCIEAWRRGLRPTAK